MANKRVADERRAFGRKVVDDVAARMARRVIDRRTMLSELDDIALADCDVDARNARGIGTRTHDRAARSALELEIAARVIRMVMGVQNMGQTPPLRVELYQDLARIRRVHGGRRAGLGVVEQIAVVVR